jgi:hypothetical protein
MSKIIIKSNDTDNLNINIMIVEDEFIIALDLKDTLKRIGYKTPLIATNGLEAIDKALEFKPDLILMDIMLKGDLDGIQAAEKIRNKFDIPILFISSFSDNKSIEHAYRISPYGYLIKPFSKYDLEAAIDQAFRIQEEKNFHGYDKFYKSFYSRFN